MFTRTKIALALVLVLGAAPAALASDHEPTDSDGGGFRVQNWQAIWGRQQANDAYHAFASATSSKKHGAVVVAPAPTRRLSREND
jgi:hypothetical protein